MNWSKALKIIGRALTQDLTGIKKTIKFFEYKPCDKKPSNLIAIDGSATFIFNLSTLWLGIIKVCALEYEFKNGYFIRDKKEKDYVEVVSTYKPINDIQDKLMKNFPFVKPNFIINELRRLYELELLRNIAERKRNSIIAIDGALTTPFLKEFEGEVKKILKACEKNGNILVGVSKDSKTHAFHPHLTDAEILEKMRKTKAYAYVELPESFAKKCKPPLYGKAYFVRLFPEARWFRIDIANVDNFSATKVFSQLSCYAMSKLSPGYIYPLVEAHKLAIKVNQLKEIYEERFKREALKRGFPLQKIIQGMTNAKGKSLGEYHTYLDEISE